MRRSSSPLSILRDVVRDVMLVVGIAACGSSERPAPYTPIAVGPSGGDVWQPKAPEPKPAPAPTPPPAPTPTVEASASVAPSASAASSPKKPPEKKPPAPKASGSAK